MFDTITKNLSDAANAASNSNPNTRHLLQTNTTITVINPVPDLQWEASIEDSYFIDASEIFSGDVKAIGVRQANGDPLPTWLTFEPEIIGSVNTPGAAYGVVVQGNVAWVADQSSGLQGVDISNPSMPVILGNVNTPRLAYDVTVQGDIAWVADYDSGLQVVDISNPSMPVMVGSVDTPGQALGVAVQGDVAWVADGGSGLQVVNISNPSMPLIVGSVDTPGQALGVAVQGHLAWVADGSSGLQGVNISNPSMPVIVGSVDTPWSAYDVAVQGDVAWVADSVSLQAVDISNPSMPVIVGSVDTPGFARGVAVQGHVAWVADDDSGLQLLDISNPSMPVMVGSVDTPGFAQAVAVQGHVAWVADYTGLQAIDLRAGPLRGTATRPLVGHRYLLELIAYDAEGIRQASDSFWLTVNQLPKRQDSALSEQSLFPEQGLVLNLDSDALFIEPDGGLLSLSVSLTSGQALPAFLSVQITPTFLGRVDTPGSARAVTVQGDVAWVADGDSGLQGVDISNPSMPVIVGSVDTPGLAWAVAVQGDVAWVADGSSGLQAVDISNPSMPVIMGSVNTPGSARGIAVQGDVAWVASAGSGLQGVDISNPSMPVIMGSVDTPGFALGVAVQGHVAWVADDDSGLQVVDISNPSMPVRVGSVDTPRFAHGVAVQGNLACVTDKFSGLHVVDISSPSMPVIVASLYTLGQAWDVAVQGDVAWVASAASGLQGVDISNPSMPVIVGSVDTPGNARAVAAQGSTAYVADDDASLSIYDLSTWEFTANPTEADVGNYEIVVTATDELGGSASDSFTLRVEGPPVFNGTLTNHSIAVGDAFNYFIPQGIVKDPNFDLIEFDANLINGNNLPSWLGFNTFSARFTGTPNIDGVYDIRISATDNIAGSTSSVFRLTVGYKPEINEPISDPAPWREGKTFAFEVPMNSFVNLNGNALLYSAGLENNLPFPSWLNFDAMNRAFNGAPPEGSAASFIIVLTATDALTALSADQTFVLQVTTNFAPELANPISRQTAQVSEPFSFTFSDNTFADPNGDTLTYSAEGAPDWLTFDANTRTFNGTAGHGDTNSYSNRDHSITVTASDGDLAMLTSFLLSVEGTSRLELGVRIGSPLLTVVGLTATVIGFRYLCYNRCCKNKYEQLEERATLNETGDLLALDCDGNDVTHFVVKTPRAEPTKTCGLFSSTERTIPNGLPAGLDFFPKTNELIVTDIEKLRGFGTLTIQARNASNQILAEIKVDIDRLAANDAQYVSETDNPVFDSERGVGVPMSTFAEHEVDPDAKAVPIFGS